jgi:quercetin dioxygenase-like cupin family protein
MSHSAWLSVASALAIGLAAPVNAQSTTAKPRPSSCTIPASERTQEAGCYVIATEMLGRLPAEPLFWHIYSYPDVQTAERARGTSTGTAVESLGKAWLFKIAPASWKPSHGRREATIGPLSIVPGVTYVARYMESIIPPGPGGTPVHRHPGPEAWYLVDGMQCIRTPGRTIVLHAGETAFVPGGVPMTLAHSKTKTRRALVLVLQDSSQPWMTKANDWKPDTNCPD